jgi:hypothetical protein
MIISPDKTKVFLAITKNGSTTVEYLLSQIPGVIHLNDMRIRHGDRGDLQHQTEINPLVADVDAQTVECFAFIRNPADRFFSACNYLKRFPYALVNLFPEKFRIEEFTIPTNEFQRRWTLAEWLSMPLALRTRIRNLTAEDFISIPEQKLGYVMREQWHWFQLGTTGLRYDDFQNETRRLIGIFGGDTTVNIPNLNAADDFPTATQYVKTHEIYMEMFRRYQRDYRLLEEYGIDH